MTTATGTSAPRDSWQSGSRPWVAAAIDGWALPVLLVLGLGAVVGLRWLAVRAGADPLLVGAAFGGLLLGVAGAGLRIDRHAHRGDRTSRRRPGVGMATALAAGVGFGLLLVGITVLAPALAGTTTVPGLGRPAAPFAAWAAITIAVAAGEELLLRGLLLDRVGRVAGLLPAVAVTSLVFALMHVPLYGWQVVPLDLAVGLGLAGLRLTTRSIAAPVVAHAVADLATWWL